jgi:hypothetical protein
MGQVVRGCSKRATSRAFRLVIAGNATEPFVQLALSEWGRLGGSPRATAPTSGRPRQVGRSFRNANQATGSGITSESVGSADGWVASRKLV